MNGNMKLAVIYCRYSPRKNASECLSNVRQIDLCTKFCDQKGWHVLQQFCDEQLSGANADRPGLQAAMKLAMKHKAVLVVYSISRFARSVKDALELSERLNKRGCNLASVTEPIDTTTAMGRAFFAIMAIIYQLERETIAERTSVAMIHHLENGRRLGGDVPYGWHQDPMDPTRMMEHEAEQAVIQQVINLYESGHRWRCTQICRWLNQRGLLARDDESWVSNRNFRRIQKAMRRRGYSPQNPAKSTR